MFADAKDLPETAPEKHGPLLPVIRLPVGCDDGRAGQILAVGKVVVDKILPSEQVGIVIPHLVELKDGRVIERDVFPLYRDGNIVGKIAHLTDVTPTKKTETN